MFFRLKRVEDLIEQCIALSEEEKKLTCCFTGHRPQKLAWGFNEQDERCIAMRKRTKEEIEKAIQQGYTIFISGMALGFDMICAELVLELKKKYPNIKLICALPCKDQYAIWKDKSQQDRYKKILKKADSVRCLYERYDDNTNCNLERNDYMLNNSSMVIALFNGKRGGTQSTILKAERLGLKTIIIEP